MRTTLKRGYGRVVDPNGNGRSGPSPSTRSPMTRYQPAGPDHHGPVRTVLGVVGWFLMCVLVVVAGLAGGVGLWWHDSLAATAPKSPDALKAAPALKVVEADKPATALVIGYDHRADDHSGDPSRSDTIMLLRADPRTHTLTMLSFPRDLITTIHCPRRIPYDDRINAAYSECGSRGTVDTVHRLTGLDINYLITVNFRGFTQVVDKLGGVWIDVDRRYLNDNSHEGPGSTFALIDLQPGYQKLKGEDALAFVRYRHTDSDLYRVARQQAFVKAAKLQLSGFSILKIPGLVNAVVHNTEATRAGAKGIDSTTLLKYANFLHGLEPGHFFQPKIENLQPAGPQGYELSASQGDIDAAVHDFVHPDVEASTAATDSLVGRKPKRKKTVRPADVTITTLNGNGVTGSAGAAADGLRERGYRVVVPPDGHPANAPNWNYFHTKVYYDPSEGGGRVAAAQVAKLFAAADVAKLPPSLITLANRAQQTVIVGSTFKGTLAPVPVDHTPKREPASIATNPEETRATLAEKRRQVPFPLQLPTVLERTSSLDDGYGETPIRVYKIDGKHKAVWLTYRTGANEYWQVGETDWADAPILQGPNTQVRLKGRPFQLYYSGSKLHMVVLRDHGARYWVVNTLLDSVSNPTMLAIAKGLRPLPR